MPLGEKRSILPTKRRQAIRLVQFVAFEADLERVGFVPVVRAACHVGGLADQAGVHRDPSAQTAFWSATTKSPRRLIVTVQGVTHSQPLDDDAWAPDGVVRTTNSSVGPRDKVAQPETTAMAAIQATRVRAK